MNTNEVEILTGLNAGSIIEIDNTKAANALVNDYIIINRDKYTEIGRTYFCPEMVIHYELRDEYTDEVTRIRVKINIINLITDCMQNSLLDSYTTELVDRLLAKSFDSLGVSRKKIAEYTGVRQSTLSYILNNSIFKQTDKSK